MSLTNEMKKHFRTLGHDLKPVVIIGGKGLTEGVIAELARALVDHELIKVKLAFTEREPRKEAITEICRACNAELVQEIGKMALLYKQARKPKLKTSNVR